MQDLQTLLDLMTKGRGLHISILDLSGILNTPDTEIAFANVIHSRRFCDIAKSTEKGYRACLRCKMLANTKATVQKEPFSGHCFFGLYEAAMPLMINGTAAAVVYVGNAVLDPKKTNLRIEKACRHTGVNPRELCAQTELCEHLDRGDELLDIAEIVCDYLKLLHEKSPKCSARHHWLVAALKRHAEEAYCTNLVLKDLAFLYHKHEKYMGRLFKQETGVTFHEYCLRLRLEKAEALLLQTSDKIIDIALACGFNTVSYFNRVFQEKNGLSPTAYRQTNRRNDNETA